MDHVIAMNTPISHKRAMAYSKKKIKTNGPLE